MLWLALIAASTMLVAGAAAAIGAWLIPPFAGLEVGLVWYAFRIVGNHDADYETLCVNEHEFRWEQRCGKRITKLQGSRQWVRFARLSVGAGCEVHLQYGGKSVELGRLMTQAQREGLSVELGQIVKRASETAAVR